MPHRPRRCRRAGQRLLRVAVGLGRGSRPTRTGSASSTRPTTRSSRWPKPASSRPGSAPATSSRPIAATSSTIGRFPSWSQFVPPQARTLSRAARSYRILTASPTATVMPGAAASRISAGWRRRAMPESEPPPVRPVVARPAAVGCAPRLAIITATCGAAVGGRPGAIELRWTRGFDAPYPALAASTDPAIVAEGEYLVYSAAACAYCHVPREQWDALDRGERLPLTGHHLFPLAVRRHLLGQHHARRRHRHRPPQRRRAGAGAALRRARRWPGRGPADGVPRPERRGSDRGDLVPAVAASRVARRARARVDPVRQGAHELRDHADRPGHAAGARATSPARRWHAAPTSPTRCRCARAATPTAATTAR